MTINSVILTGNLTADPKKGKAGETPLIEFSVAVNEYRSGEEIANFFDCTMYGKRATAIVDYLKKGQRVTIMGKLQQRRWMKDDEKRSKVSIVVFDIDFISPKQDNEKDDIPW